MNFKDMPDIAWEQGYLFGLGLMGLSSLATWGVFRWRKWL